jgi:hypothetical protein
MSVRLNGNVIVLEGQCRVEDAEPLLGWLQADGSRIVDIAAADHLHTAVVQVLMALRPGIRGTGNDVFVRDWIVPALTKSGPADTMTQEG